MHYSICGATMEVENTRTEQKGEYLSNFNRLTINKLFQKHKDAYPDSALSLKAIRRAVKSGELPSVESGNRKLICEENFNKWLKGKAE